MSTYAWTARSVLEPTTRPVFGPSDITPTQVEELNQGDTGEEFQIRNDDGVLDFNGRIIGDYDGFEPLDDYATPAYGSTAMFYRDPTNSEWSQL